MKPLFTEDELNKAKSKDLLPCQCYNCKQTFYLSKHRILNALDPNQHKQAKFCSRKCAAESYITKEKVICKNCGNEFFKVLEQIKRHPNHFCSKSCAAIYNNKHKSVGTRRSKLETWLESQLTLLYPKLEIHFNQKDAINSELDIYFPSLKLAFELNGIFHYEPIYGISKLNQIKENDVSKSKACHDAKIDLCVIDTSGQKYFKESTSKKYLTIIINIINERLLIS